MSAAPGPFSAIVLAGGRSSRFGRDKLAEPLAGRPLLDHAVRSVAGVARDVVILGPGLPVSSPAGSMAVPRGVTVRFVPDAEPFAGPLVALAAGLVVLALARRRAWPLAAAAATLVAGVAFASVFTSVAPETHFFPEEIAFQEEQARLKGGLPAGNGTISLAEPSIRSHLRSLREDAEEVVRHPQGFGLGNAGAVARRTDETLLAGESNLTEIGAQVGLGGLALFLAWSLALLAGLVRVARRRDEATSWAAAGVAASLAAVLALAVQTDAVGVPWLAFCLWWLGGALVVPAAASLRAPAPARARGKGATTLRAE